MSAKSALQFSAEPAEHLNLKDSNEFLQLRNTQTN